ncbi:Uncharacterized protein DAT39_005574, partial [Clarias magur]
ASVNTFTPMRSQSLRPRKLPCLLPFLIIGRAVSVYQILKQLDSNYTVTCS